LSKLDHHLKSLKASGHIMKHPILPSVDYKPFAALFLWLVMAACPMTLIFSQSGFAQEPSAASPICSIEDRACILKAMTATAAKIEQTSWRDQTYREIAKTLAFEGDIEGAVALISKIETPDTKAMTIRGIGMAAAEQRFKDRYAEIFALLRSEAEKIEHPPSYAIALTYIAMSQAFAGDSESAWKTASDMKNDALRHKAYAETAEIQAEQGNFDHAMKSIAFIESESFRNKAYVITSRILAEKGKIDDGYQAAMKITNPYQKAAAVQTVLDIQKPRENEKPARADP
jgi:hypothetical protein